MSVKFWTTAELMRALCEREKISTDYGLAKFLQVDKNTVAGWRRGYRIMSDDHVARVAALLGEDAGWLALCLALERVKSASLSQEMRRVLLAAANRAALVALAVLPFAAYYAGQFVGI